MIKGTKKVLEKDDHELNVEMYTFPTKDSIYFLWRNLKNAPDHELVKAVQKYKEKKKKYKKLKEKGENAKKPVKPIVDENQNLAAQF